MKSLGELIKEASRAVPSEPASRYISVSAIDLEAALLPLMAEQGWLGPEAADGLRETLSEYETALCDQEVPHCWACGAKSHDGVEVCIECGMHRLDDPECGEVVQ